MLIALAAGAVVVIVAAVVVLRPNGSVEPPALARSVSPSTSTPVEREGAAEALLARALRDADGRRWRTAQGRLAELDEAYAHTDTYSINATIIARLRADIGQALEPTGPTSATGAAPDPLAAWRRAIEALRPRWATREYADALGAARTLAAEELAATPDAATWLIEDAEALAHAWKAVEAGAAALKPGETVAIAGVAGAFEKLEDGAIVLRQGEIRSIRPLAALGAGDLVALARKALKDDGAQDCLGVAWLWIQDADRANARDALAFAKEAGVDTTRHATLIGAPAPEPTIKRAKLPPRKRAKTLAFTGGTVTIEAEEPDVCIEPMQYQADATATGGGFLWEPRAPGQDRSGDKDGRAVYYVRSDRERTVQLWARVRAANNDSNSVYVAVAPGRTTRGDLKEWHFGISPNWVWAAYDRRSGPDRAGRTPTPIRLRAGYNAIIIAIRERACPLDSIRITEQKP